MKITLIKVYSKFIFVIFKISHNKRMLQNICSNIYSRCYQEISDNPIPIDKSIFLEQKSDEFSLLYGCSYVSYLYFHQYFKL